MTWTRTGRVVDALREKHPKLAREADHENSRRAAIHLFCLECQGGSRPDVIACAVYNCPLWPYRPGEPGTRPEAAVPTTTEYEAMMVAKYGDRLDELRARGAALGARRGKRDDADPFEGIDDVDPFEGIEER